MDTLKLLLFAPLKYFVTWEGIPVHCTRPPEEMLVRGVCATTGCRDGTRKNLSSRGRIESRMNKLTREHAEACKKPSIHRTISG